MRVQAPKIKTGKEVILLEFKKLIGCQDPMIWFALLLSKE
jgi:hypothetical protein